MIFFHFIFCALEIIQGHLISIKLMHKVNSVKQLFVGIKAALQTSVVANHLQRDHALQRC